MSKVRTIKRWSFRLLLVCVVVLGLLRLGIPLALPTLLANWAESQDLEASYDELNLSLVTGEFELWHFTLKDRVDRNSMHFEFVTLDFDMVSLLSGRPRIARVEVDGLDLNVVLEPSGLVELGRLTKTDNQALADADRVDLSDSGDSVSSEDAEQDREPLNLILPFELAALRLQEVHLNLVDRTIDPPIHSRFELGVRCSDIGSKTRATRVEVRLSSPGLMDALRISAELTTDAKELNLATNIEMAGLHPKTIDYLLNPLGIIPRADLIAFHLDSEIRVQTGTLENTATTVDFGIEGTRLLINGQSEFSVAEISGQLIDGPSASEGLRVTKSTVSGIRGDVVKLENGAWLAAGLEFAAAGGESVSVTTEEASTDEAGGASVFVLDEFTLGDVALGFQDRSVVPGIEIGFELEQLKVSNFTLGAKAPVEPARLSLSFGLPGIIERAELEGDFALPNPNGRVDLAVGMQGINLEKVEPYLKASQLRPLFDIGSFNCQLSASVRSTDSGFEDAQLMLRNLNLVGDEEELFAIDQVSVQGVEISPSRTLIGDVELSGVRLPIRHNSMGELEFFGLAMLAAASESTPEADGGKAVAAERKSAQPTASDESTALFELGRFAWSDSSVRYSDERVEPAKSLALNDLSMELEGLLFGGPVDKPKAKPATLEASMTVAGLADELSLSGQFEQLPGTFEVALDAALKLAPEFLKEFKTVEPNVRTAVALPIDLSLQATVGRVFGNEPMPIDFDLVLGVGEVVEEFGIDGRAILAGDDTRLDARLHGRGLSQGELAQYLPEGLGVTLSEGRFDVSLSAGLVPLDAQALDNEAQRAWLELSDFALTEGEEQLVIFDSIALKLGLIDQVEQRYSIDELAVRGLELDLVKTAANRMEVAGVALTSIPIEEAIEEVIEEAIEEHPVSVKEASAGIDSKAKSTSAGVATKRKAVPTVLPTVLLERLDVGITRLGFLDGTQPGAERLDFALNISNAAPTTLLDPQAAELPPIELQIRGTASPVIESIALNVTTSPYVSNPELMMTLNIDGIDGEGLTRVLPNLRGTMDGHELKGGSLETKLRSSLNWRRRGPVDFNLNSGFGSDVSLQDLRYRAEIDGEVLLALDSLDANIANINPITGAVHFRTLEIVNPTLHVKQTAEGMHILGLILKPTPVEAEGSEIVETVEPMPEVIETAEVAMVDPGPELRLDKLLIEGIDVRFRDELVSPPMLIPLNELDVEVVGFTTRAFVEPHAVRYSLHLNAGDIPLQERSEHSFLGGLATGVTNLLGADREGLEIERRALFDELSVTGRTAFFPKPSGKTKIELSALELLGFEGTAGAAGVTIGDGVLDAKIDIDMRGEGGVDVRSKFTFQHLSLEEAPGGPISRYLRLPAPLDAVLFLLKNDDGEHVIPLNFELSTDGGLSASEITAVAVSTLVRLITDAIASSPLRIVGSVTDVIGLTDLMGFGGEDDLSEDSVSLLFAAADPALQPGSAKVLESLIEQLDDDDELSVVLQHVLGEADLRRAQILANPNPEDCLNLARRLRQKKLELTATRDGLAAEARAHYAVGRTDEAAAVSRQLRAIDSEVGQTENSLDQLYEFLRPGSERREDKRTRIACLEISRRRLERVRDVLMAAGIPEDRIDLRRARFELSEGVELGSVHLAPRR